MTDRSRTLRLHVGGLSKSLVEDISDLEDRFSKVGTIVTPFEIRHKPVAEYNYAYVTMRLTKEELRKLQSSFNGVQYKGSKLTIGLARPDYHERWLKNSRRQDMKVSDRRKNSELARLRNIRIEEAHNNPFDAFCVVRGRLRETPRKIDPKKMTMRVLIGGKLKFPRSKKNKLWGYDKTRKPRDLSYECIGGKWRDGNGHIIERHVRQHALMEPSEYEEEAEAAVEEEEIGAERDRNTGLLESLMGNYDFEKPVDLEDDNSEYESGTEFEDGKIEISDDEEATDVKTRSDGKSALEEYQKQHPEFTKKEKEPATVEKVASSDDTEKLRSLLNPPESDFKFSFGGPQEDEDELSPIVSTAASVSAPSIIEPSIPAPSVSIPSITAAPRKDVGLFFTHFESPFLVAQTQLSRLQQLNAGKDLDYEKWFWANRGDLNRTFRRKRRDAMKHSRKERSAIL
ncbi:DEKNAAC101428 [Brettanomyces naardenensis]|uniref:DEKNAAC101428 n=1 Tax=Brettanomyces naardenensis TaxID=13370 RepID=A0A448YI72_BRENA|nr:DEKNAAC101428 [Brettanomyces naardenensis]